MKEADIPFLAESAYADACRPGNPRDTSVEEIAAAVPQADLIPTAREAVQKRMASLRFAR